MTFDHLLALLKFVPSIIKKEKAPAAVSPGFDGRDAAIFFLGISLIFAVLAVLNLAALAARR